VANQSNVDEGPDEVEYAQESSIKTGNVGGRAGRLKQMSNLLGQRIRRAREREGLTQAALADKVGVKQATVAVWEAGRGRAVAHKKMLETILGPLSSKSPSGKFTQDCIAFSA
jgi:ribosome-binding protein aMBF1 (putative translation factor)